MSASRKILRKMMLGIACPTMPPAAPFRKFGFRIFRVLRVEHQMGFKQAYAIAAMHAYGENCWKTEKQIAKFIGACRSTVSKAVKKAREIGALICQRVKVGEIPPGGSMPTKTGLANRKFTATGIKSLSRQAAIWASWAVKEVFHELGRQRYRADAAERAEAREACAELRHMPD